MGEPKFRGHWPFDKGRTQGECVPFDIRQLRYAIAAADHGSFYRASRMLDVEQSTLSRAILKLERVIGGRIFNRSQSGVSMTLSGAQFIRAARPMVANAEKMVTTMRAAGQGCAGGLMIGHNSAISAGHLRATQALPRRFVRYRYLSPSPWVEG